MVSQRQSAETDKTFSGGNSDAHIGNGAAAQSQTGDRAKQAGDQAGDQGQGFLSQGADKVRAMADGAMSQAQEIAGQASGKAKEMAGRAFDQAQERAPEMMAQAPQQILDTSTGFFRRLEMMSPENYYYAAVGALGATALLTLFGRRSLASFVGLWTALLLNLGLFSRILRTMEPSRNSGHRS